MASWNRTVQIRGDLARQYDDVCSDTALDAIAALAELNEPRLDLMRRRIARRAGRARERRRIDFLPSGATIAGTDITVADARAGRFTGSAIPGDLQRQWIQGTGPGAKPDAPLQRSIRNVAYALLSGADGWMFDGEDALGQVTTMSLDNQRNLRLGIARAPAFLAAAEGRRRRDERLGGGLPEAADHRRLARAARLHHHHLPGARPAPGRPPRAHGGRHRPVGLDRRRRAVRGGQPRGAARARSLGRPLPAQDPDRRGGGLLAPAAQRAGGPPGAQPPAP